MYCPNCGKKTADNATTCSECGAGITEPVAPRRKDSSTRATVAALCFVGVICFAVFAPVWQRAKEGLFNEPCCQNNLKELAIAVQLYTNDYGGSMPQSSKWCDLVYKYVTNKEAYVCPSARRLKSGYGMNSSLEIMLDNKSTSDIVMLFESDNGWNAHGGMEAMLPKSRHGVVNVAYMDTHTNAVSDEKKKRLLW